MPKKVTTETKKLQGTAQPCRLAENQAPPPEFDLVTDYPPPPAGLDEAGAEMWNDIGPQLVAQRVLQVVDLYSLEVLCCAWQQYRANLTNGHPQTLQAFTTLRILFSDFGMNPASRSKLIKTDPPKPDNAFAGHGRKA